MSYEYHRYTSRGSKVYVFSLSKWISVIADNESDAEDAAYTKLYEMMQHDLESFVADPKLELKCLGRKVYDNKLHEDVFLSDEKLREAVLAGDIEEEE